MIYYSKRTQVKISKGKRHLGEVQEKPGANSSVPLLLELQGMCLILLAVMGDYRCKVLPTREAHLSLGVQEFY